METFEKTESLLFLLLLCISTPQFCVVCLPLFPHLWILNLIIVEPYEETTCGAACKKKKKKKGNAI